MQIGADTPPSKIKTRKVRGAIAGVIAAAVVEFLVPGAIVLFSLISEHPIDQLRQMIIWFVGVGEAICIACNIIAAVLLIRGSGTGRLFAIMGMMGLLSLAILDGSLDVSLVLAILGVVVGVCIAILLFSREMEEYLGETYEERW